jgi:hypothetical protein
MSSRKDRVGREECDHDDRQKRSRARYVTRRFCGISRRPWCQGDPSAVAAIGHSTAVGCSRRHLATARNADDETTRRSLKRPAPYRQRCRFFCNEATVGT